MYYPYSYPYPLPHPYDYSHSSFQPYNRFRQYPPVDESTFIQSVQAFQKITQEASIILGKFSDRKFANQLMTAAQHGNQQEVDQIMKSIGVTSQIDTKYTPTGIQLKIHANTQGSVCCTLTMYLKWGN